MELYTSLVRLKQEMNNGVLPPMTPVPLASLALIDPALTIGQGGLFEDAEKGLRCPVRGCGKFSHFLATHLNKSHAGIGGASAVRAALDIPPRVSLVSARARASREPVASRPKEVSVANLRRCRGTGPAVSRTRNSVAYKNLIDRCLAQLSQKILSLADELGRAPTEGEFKQRHGEGAFHAVKNAFGSWSSAKAQFDLQVYDGRKIGNDKRRIPRAAVLEALSAWHEAHGDLPLITDAANRDGRQAPYVPSVNVVLRAFDTSSWPEAMRRAAAVLNIFGGRYGLPTAIETYRQEKAKRSTQGAA